MTSLLRSLSRSFSVGLLWVAGALSLGWVPGLAVDQQPKTRMDEVIYGCVRDFAGSISAEHGIGTTKRPYLGHARTPEEIALMRTLKAALDPLGLLNPGKVI